VLGKIDLPPTFGPAQLPDTLASRSADVPCHVDIIELAFTLDLVHTLSAFHERAIMRRFLAVLLVACCVVCAAQSRQIKSEATAYIEPMDGYETDLAAAFMKKHVPLILVADPHKADYIITSSMAHRDPSQPAVVVNNSNTNVAHGGATGGSGNSVAQAMNRPRQDYGATRASISVIAAQSSEVVFAYSVGKHANTNQVQSTAEACAKHLKEFIGKSQK
jgi:hypothetical protein